MKGPRTRVAAWRGDGYRPWHTGLIGYEPDGSPRPQYGVAYDNPLGNLYLAR